MNFRPIFAIALISIAAVVVMACGESGSEEPAPAATVPAASAQQEEQGSAAGQRVAATRPAPSATPYSGRIPAPIHVTVTATPAPAASIAPAVAQAADATATPATAAVETPATTQPANVHCGSFGSPQEAQQFYLDNDGPFVDRYSLDTDDDGIACNSQGDSGIEQTGFPLASDTPVPTATASVSDKDCGDFDTWADANNFFLSEGGPYSDPHRMDPDRDGLPCSSLYNAERYTPTPTPEPTSVPTESVWSDPERTAELNSINWHGFDVRGFPFRIHITPAGEKISAFRLDNEGKAIRMEVECGPIVGNRFDQANPTFNRKNAKLYIWIEPDSGEPAHCVRLDRYIKWKATDPLPVPWGTNPATDTQHAMPPGVRGESMLFTQPGDTKRRHTRLPVDILQYMSVVMGEAYDFYGKEMQCKPEKMPLAVWSDELGFQALGRDEEKLLAEHALNHERYVDDSDGFWKSYDWESKENWRELGWYVVLYRWEYKTYENEHWRNHVKYIYPDGLESNGLKAGCWSVSNLGDVPPPRRCYECERREQMALYAE